MSAKGSLPKVYKRRRIAQLAPVRAAGATTRWLAAAPSLGAEESARSPCVMSNVVGVIPDHAARTAIAVALGTSVRLQYCSSFLEVEVRTRREAVITVLIQWDGASALTESVAFGRLRRSLTSTPILVVAHRSRLLPHQVVALVNAGVDEVVDAATLFDLRRLVTQRSSAWRQRLLSELEAATPPDLWTVIAPLVVCCLTMTDVPSVATAARALGVPVRTLAARHRAAGTLAPGTVISWCRLILAVRMLEDPRRSVEQVAHALGFGDGPGLRNMLRRYTGLRVSEVRSATGGRHVVHMCVAALYESASETPLFAKAMGRE